MEKLEDFYAVASYDGVVKKATAAIWILLIAESLLFVYLFSIEKPISSLSIVLTVFMPTISIIVLTVPYLYTPKGFRFTTQGLGIERIRNTIIIPYNQISTIQKGKWTWKAARLGGSGGLYGYLGFYHLFGIGKVWMYVTNRHKMLLLETKNGVKYAFSPKDPEDFVAQLQKKIATTFPEF